MLTPDQILDLKSEDVSNLQTTVCVVGSGPAGGVSALKLAQSGIDVLLVEAGGKGLNNKNDFIDQFQIDGEIDVDFGFSKQLGGSSNLWAGRTALFDNFDFEYKNWIPESGWPIQRKDIEKYFEEVADILDIPSQSLFENIEINDHFKNSDNTEIKPFQWAKKPKNIWEHIRKNATPHLKVLFNAPVVKLQKKGKVIESIDIQKPSGELINVKASIFVIAAGGIETPRLLLNSRIGNENMGCYFSTHPKANIAALVFKNPVKISDPLFTNITRENGTLRYGLAISDEIQKQSKLLNHYVQLSPLMEHNANLLFEKIKGSKVIRSPFIEESKLMKGMLPGLGLILLQLLERSAGVQKTAKKFILRGFLDQFPNKDNKIELSTALDHFGNNKANINWRFTNQDKQSVINFLDTLDKDLRKHANCSIEYTKLKKLDQWPLIGIHSHFMGATRMGNDPKNSVTDKNGKIHGYDNIYISGPSLFPTYGFANPFYTIVSLSLRLAEHLQSQLKML